MNKTELTKVQQTEQECPALVKTIGNTTYIVNVRFSETAKETLQKKIERMLVDEVRYGNAV